MTREPLSAGLLVRVLLRSFAVQGSWNYRTLIGCGFAFALLPVLRSLYAHRPEEYRAAVQRHTAVFNSHPYLAPMALGAISVLEGSEEPAVIDRFKSAVRGSLGSLGDRLIWAGFRPVCILLAVCAVLLGAGWWVATAGFLLIYNIGHVGVRLWALRFGLQHGLRLGERLRAAPVERIQAALQAGGSFLLGLALVMLVAGRPLTDHQPGIWTAAAAGAGALGIVLGSRTRVPVTLALAAFAAFSILGGALL